MANTAQKTIDPARAELAKAIADEERARKVFERVSDAIARARGNLAQARGRLETARTDVVRAKEAGTERAVAAAAAGEAIAPDKTIRAARARETEAADEVETYEGALATLEAQLAEPEAALRRATMRVEDAVAPILASGVDRLLADVQKLQDELNARYAQLNYLNPIACLDRIGMARQGTKAKEVEELLNGILDGERQDSWPDHPAVKPWRDAREQLLRDPNAPIPKS